MAAAASLRVGVRGRRTRARGWWRRRVSRVCPRPSATMGEMTDLLSRPILRVPQAAAGPDRPVALVAGVGAAAVAAGGLLLCLALGAAGWFAADTGSFGNAMAIAVLGWLLGSGTGLAGGGVA